MMSFEQNDWIKRFRVWEYKKRDGNRIQVNGYLKKKTKGKENRLQKEKEKGNKEILILLKEALAEELDEEEETASRGKKKP